jgi:peptidoglycan/xylan/chitin deacetylase (PgdA/CDA1 family)
MTRRRPLAPLVLALHQTPARPAWAPMAVDRETLRRVLGTLLERGYRFLPLRSVGPEGPAEGEALLTVDDGYGSTHDVLAPLALELGIPWSVFVVVGAVGGRNDWDVHGVAVPERHLRREEIRALAESGVAIGSHGMTHRDFTKLDDRSLASELRDSRAWLETATGRRVDAISYPWGREDARVAAAVRAAGYRIAFGLRAPRGRGAAGAARRAVRRTALYAPDRIPGLFRATALASPRAGRALRDAAGAAASWIVARTLAATGRAHA